MTTILTKGMVFQESMFDIVMTMTYILYIAVVLGVSVTAPNYLDYVQYFTKLYIGLFLLARFNPYQNQKCTSLDIKIIFNAAIFILASLVITPDNLFYIYPQSRPQFGYGDIKLTSAYAEIDNNTHNSENIDKDKDKNRDNNY